MKRSQNLSLLISLWISDVALMVISYIAAYAIRFSPAMPVPHGIPSFWIYLRILPFFVLIYFLVMRSYGLYRPGKHISILEEFFLVGKAVFVGSFILMASSFVYREFSYSRGMLVISAFMLIILTFANRVVFHYLQSKMARVRGLTRNILLVGHGPSMELLIDGLTKNHKGLYAVMGLLSNKDELGSQMNGVTVIGSIDDFDATLDQIPVDEVILGEMNVPRKRIVEMILKCEEKLADFKMVSDLLGQLTNKLDVENINGVSLLGIKETPLHHPANRFIKRSMDILISVIALLIFSPLVILISLLVKGMDGGPILYKQERTGEDGKVFNIYKFRSMKVNAEAFSGPQFASEEDPRTTRLGAFLRRSNLDEIPQLFNVIRGNMSLVGPRPERPVFVDQLKTDIPRYMARHKVRSGITGWAQVNGLRGGPPSEERIKYDLYYIENWSFWLDLKILLMTPFAFKNAR